MKEYQVDWYGKCRGSMTIEAESEEGAIEKLVCLLRNIIHVQTLNMKHMNRGG